MDPLEFLNLFGQFCEIMQVELPTARIDQYAGTLFGFSKDILESAFKQWALNHPPRFMPSPNDLISLAIEINEREEIKSGPRTVKDLFGDRTRTETPLARELRNILKQLIGTPTFKGGKVEMCGTIDGKLAMELIEEAEKKHGPASGESVPKRSTVDECLSNAGVDMTLAVRARRKRDCRMDHKMNEFENAELHKLARFLLSYGHFIVRAKEEKLEIESMDDDAWRESFGILHDYAERI